MTATALAITGHLGQVIAIAVAVLIGLGILILGQLAGRRSPDDAE
jgi:hypothetical protein